MAHLGQQYGDDSVQRQVMDGFPLPDDTYIGRVTRTEIKDTKKRDGKYLEVEFAILEPKEFNKRNVWDRIQFQNPNVKTMEIAKEQMEDLRQAAGIQLLEYDEQLQDAIVQMEIVVDFAEEYTDSHGNKKMGKDGNKILKYWHHSVNVEVEKDRRKGGGNRNAPSQPSAGATAGVAQQQPGATNPAQGQGATWHANAQQPAQGGQPAHNPHQRPPATDQASSNPPAAGGSPMPWKRNAPRG